MIGLSPGNHAPTWIAVITVSALLGGCSSASAGSTSPAGPTPSTSTPAATTKAAAQHHKRHKVLRHPRHHKAVTLVSSAVPSVDMPNRRLTPGVSYPVTVARICTPGYAGSVRNVPESEKRAVYARYGVVDVPYAHEVDHLVSLEIGGSNSIRNLWPEPYSGKWGASTKDQVENALHDLVCSGRLGLKAAQRMEAANWVAAYKRYVSAVPLGHSRYSYGGGSGATGAPSAGGYYASSYPSAYTIYCADDPEWRSLSKRYLVDFPTLAAALKRFPGRHLHRPC